MSTALPILTEKELDQANYLLTEWRKCPIVRHYSFSDKKLWAKQEEILRAYRSHKYLAVRSGNTVGKSFIAADIVLDWLAINYPAKVLTTAPGWTQVEDILWREIAVLYRSSKIPIAGPLLRTELTLGDDWFAKGISTDRLDRFQGFHSPHLLILIDEASGVKDEIWDAIDSLHPEKVVAIGNPLLDYGRFYKAFQSSLWHKIKIGCRECVEWQNEHGAILGLTTQRWINEQIEFHGPKSDYVAIHVDGEFPEQSESTLISRAWVERARKGLNAAGQPLDDESEEDNIRILSTDVATKHGANATVIAYRYGHTFKEIASFYRIPITQTRDKILFRFNRYAYGGTAPKIVIDSDGVGEGLGDMFTAESVPHIEFHGGYSQQAMDTVKYHNLRTQFYCVVAKKFEKGLYNLKHLDDKSYEILKNQLCSIHVKPPDGQGRIQIETKEDMLANGIESPDSADAFMMSEFAYFTSNLADLQPYSYR